MRIEMAKILLRHPDVLLLDEPTNHLDIESIQWFEKFLAGYDGAVMLVSHDRAFINNVTTRTIEITCGQIHDYKVKYDEYLTLRAEPVNSSCAPTRTSAVKSRRRRPSSSASATRPPRPCRCSRR